MGYVGNQQAEGFVQRPTKQDLTGATGTSLTLSHAVSKEEDIDLYINNVKQEPTTAYTVADTAVTLTGSVVATDDIYVVYNSLALQTVTPPDGSVTSAKLATDAVTTAKIQDNAVTAAKMFSSFNNGIIELDQYRLTSDFTTDASTISGFERVDDATFSKLGTGMSESSGVFTFPSTGLWVVFTAFDLSYTTSDTVGYQAEVSSNSGTSFDSIAVVFEGHSNGNGSAVTFNVVNVTDASAFRFRTFAISMNSGSAIKGDTDQNRSSLLFIRIADAQ